jgi:hypothetical protein
VSLSTPTISVLPSSWYVGAVNVNTPATPKLFTIQNTVTSISVTGGDAAMFGVDLIGRSHIAGLAAGSDA